MPVGCLGDRPAEVRNMDIMVTSSVLNTADQFAFMQQTLLLQIFRVPPIETIEGGPCCPTCVAFADFCCQQENGQVIFQEFLEANSQMYWDPKLIEAIDNLRYQGYVCPGILVLIANTTHLETLADAWRRRLLHSPARCKLSQVSLSTGCTVKPIMQIHTVALGDFICQVLARLKQRPHQTADMDTILEIVRSEWPGSTRTENLREAVHSNLGSLIKQRKVYYTGKGYFLVTPEATAGKLGNRLSRLRHSLRAAGRAEQPKNGHRVDAECQTTTPQTTTPQTTPPLETSPAEESSPKDAASLERSQSLRLSKKSLRSLAKGGSLRLSRREATIFKEEDPEASPAHPVSRPMERKNSFLGKLFSSTRKRSTGSVKPELGTFSAQFPPPELQPLSPAKDLPSPAPQPIYADIHKPSSPQATQQVRNGPSGNFVVYERSRQPPAYGFSSRESVYSNPPPPLPYRPPPPNPYDNPNYSPTKSSSNSSPSVSSSRSSNRSVVTPSNRGTPTNASPLPKSSSTASPKVLPKPSPSTKRSTDQSPLNNRHKAVIDVSESSGPSSIESQVLFGETLVVIEKSNNELERKLSSPKRLFKKNLQSPSSRQQLSRHRIDTIHNNRNLSQEVIYEIDGNEISLESRSSSQSTLKPPDPSDVTVAPSYPSLDQLSAAELGTTFKSLTAQKLMAGLSMNSIDTLLEVNAAAEARHDLDQSTETIDFGVI